MRKNEISQAGEPTDASLKGRTNPPHRILVVDDDPYICHLSAEMLIRHGYEVNAAEDGAAAWEELQANRYNLLITDKEIPRASPAELRAERRAARMALPVIMVIRTSPQRESAPHPRLQPVATLLDPYPFEELLEIVKNILVSRWNEKPGRVTGNLP
jgi:DNA-binding NtrC family response regulator